MNGNRNGLFVKGAVVVLAAVLSLVGWLLVQDRNHISKTGETALGIALENGRDIAVLKTMRERLKRIENKQDKILERLGGE